MDILLYFLIAVSTLSLFVLVYLLYFLYSKDQKIRSHNNRVQNKVSKKIEKEAEKQLEEIMQKVQKRLEAAIDNNFAKVSDLTSFQTKEITDFVKEQEGSMIKQSEYMVANAVDKVEKELSTYRDTRMKKMNDLIFTIIGEVTKEVIGKTINPNEHEKLVEEAVKRAQSDKFFQ